MRKMLVIVAASLAVPGIALAAERSAMSGKTCLSMMKLADKNCCAHKGKDGRKSRPNPVPHQKV
jgi:hypothetical protein